MAKEDTKPEEKEQTEEKTSEEKTEEKTAEEKKEWDKQQQQLDQERANVRKITEEKLALSEQLGAASERAESFRAKVAELESQLADKQAQREEEVKLDPDLHDPAIIKVIDKLNREIAAEKELLGEAQTEIKALKDKATQYEKIEQQRQETTAKETRKEKILGALDKRYGAKFRNDAIKLAQKKVDEKGEAPADELEVYLLLDGCYEELSKKAPKEETKEKVRVDSGEGGVAFKEGEIKEGDRESVWSQMLPKLKGKKFTLPSP